MKKTVKKKKNSKKRAASSSSPSRGVFLLSICLAIAGAGAYVYHVKKPTVVYDLMISGISATTTLINEGKHFFSHDVKSGLDKVKDFAANKNENTDIHFEFYTALPNMEMPVSEMEADVNPPVTKVAATEAAKPLKSAAPTVAAKPAKVDATPTFITSADEIEKGMSEQLHQDAFIVQLGVFKSPASAERLKQTVNKNGLEVDVVKLTLAQKEFYRVQLGPYLSKDQAKLMLHQLQKQGVTGVIAKDVACG